MSYADLLVLTQSLVNRIETYSSVFRRLFTILLIFRTTLCMWFHTIHLPHSHFCFQNKGIADDLQQLAEHVDQLRINHGLPHGPHPNWSDGLNEPICVQPPALSNSVFPIYTAPFSEFYGMSAKDLQAIFRKYPVIVLRDRPTRLKCDLASLEEWGNVDELRTMHGNKTRMQLKRFL